MIVATSAHRRRSLAIHAALAGALSLAATAGCAETTLRLTDLAGADPSGERSSVAALRAACAALNAAGGGTLIIPAGTYKIDATVNCSRPPYAQTADWRIMFEPGGKLVATPDLATSALKLFSSAPGTHSLEIVEPDIDVSHGTCAVACQGGEGLTAIEAQDQDRVEILRPHLVGGASYYNEHSNNGVTCTRVRRTFIRDGKIEGFPNGGVYCVGDLEKNHPGDYRLSVERTRFVHDNVGVQCKFSLEECRVVDAVFDHNRYALGTFRAGPHNSEPSARSVSFLRNKIKHSLRAAIWIEETRRGVIAGNLMVDVGYDEDDRPTGKDVEFLMFNGAGEIELERNVGRQTTAAGRGAIGVVIGNARFDGKVVRGGGLRGRRNAFPGLETAVYEGEGVDASQFLGTDVDGTRRPCATTNPRTVCEILSAAPPR